MSDLIERLNSHMGQADMGEVLADCRLAAAELTRLRSLVDQSGGGAEEALEALQTLEAFPSNQGEVEGRITEKGARLIDNCCDIIRHALASPPHGGRILEVCAHSHAKLAKRWVCMKCGELLPAAPVSPLREDQGASRAQDQRSAATSAKASDPIQVQSDG